MMFKIAVLDYKKFLTLFFERLMGFGTFRLIKIIKEVIGITLMKKENDYAVCSFRAESLLQDINFKTFGKIGIVYSKSHILYPEFKKIERLSVRNISFAVFTGISFSPAIS